MASKAVFVCVVIFCSLQILEGSVLKKDVGQLNLAGFDPISSIKDIIKDIEQKAKDAIEKGQEGIKIVKELFNDTIHGNEEKVKELLEQVLANITKGLPPGIKFGVEVTECTANATYSALRVAANTTRATIRCTTDEISAILGPLFDLVSGGSQLLQIISKAFEAMTCFKDIGITTIATDIQCFNKEVKAIVDQSGGYINKLVADTKKAIEALTHVKDAVVKCPPLRLADSVIAYGKVIEQFGDCVQHLVPKPSS